jgi:hypothetical protein
MASEAMAPSALSVGESAVDNLSSRTGFAEASIMRTVRLVASGMIGIAVLVIVLNEVFSIGSIANSTGPFSSVIDSLETTGAAALGLLVIGLLILSANRVMGFFGGGGF